MAEGRAGRDLLAGIQDALKLPDSDLPKIARERKGSDSPRPSPALVALLKVLLAYQCEKHDVAPKLVASSDDLDAFALDPDPTGPLLTGWRRDIFGEEALALFEGHLSLGVSGGRLRLMRADNQS